MLISTIILALALFGPAFAETMGENPKTATEVYETELVTRLDELRTLIDKEHIKHRTAAYDCWSASVFYKNHQRLIEMFEAKHLQIPSGEVTSILMIEGRLKIHAAIDAAVDVSRKKQMAAVLDATAAGMMIESTQKQAEGLFLEREAIEVELRLLNSPVPAQSVGTRMTAEDFRNVHDHDYEHTGPLIVWPKGFSKCPAE